MKENSAHGFTEGSEVPKEQDAAHSLIENKFYWIKIQQWKDRDTRIEDKWSVAKWDGESFEELNEMYRIEEVIEIGEQIPSNDELTRLRSELQQKDEWISFDEQLPKDYQRVIWFDKRGGDIEIGYFVPSQSKIQPYASHWKSLPEPPKKKS